MSSHSQQQRLALLSVTDKSGLVPFARGLVELGIGLLSTGGTAKLLREHGLPVTDVAEFTGSPEILGGRVKTLHPKVHGGILFDRGQSAHVAEAAKHGIKGIDLIVVNLYQFAAEAIAKKLPLEDAIEHIDIGGPTMLRAAAKNWRFTLPVIDPSDYDAVLAALGKGEVPKELRLKLAVKTFATIAAYDHSIASYLGQGGTSETSNADTESKATLPVHLKLRQPLRYGENPHQAAGLYADEALPAVGFAAVELLGGKELSYNNILDLDAATALAAEFSDPACVIIKHTNPCGCATSATAALAEIFRRALSCDPKSAFGGIIALNRPVDAATATAVTSLFTECVAAPDFSPEALEILRKKPNLRILRAAFARQGSRISRAQLKSVYGAMLVQSEDTGSFDPAKWQSVTTTKPHASTMSDLQFAMIVAKHVKSNAIVFAKDGVTVAIGAGQMSRIDSANIAVAKAEAEGRSVKGSVLASDAFFPFSDTVEFAASHGVAAIVQPGGSKRDQDSIDEANKHGIAMVFTGERHFRH
ncbi:MAG: bifunctional phosphoribosylaminoimidazolecarboxamide formyltransferase/IMP cyclohydrolase [Deltaproteobacteria bacterium]|nr:bifunctional phosphoribosylaminoimidazolecarboxamide formyltransferase/IMP cyclohydrolase [Deltaproteobacteria bacterium]